MSNIDRYRPPREGYQPPSLPPKPPPTIIDRLSKSPSRRRDVPPAVPSPPTHTSRTSPPRPHSRRSAPSPAQSSPQRPPQPRPPQPRPSQWYFTADEVASTPSIIEGDLSLAEERLRRAKGVNFIYQAGIILDIPQITLWVAGVFFHRFYMRCNMVEEKGGVHHYNIAATALFLANKTEENCQKTKNIIIAVAKVAQKNSKLIIDEQSKEYWRWRDSILTYEELMLEMLTFDLMVDNPYNQLYNQLKDLKLIKLEPLRDSAWAFCNDACLTVLPLMITAKDVALSAIFFASTVTHEKIDDVNGEPWWKFLKGNEANIVKAVSIITEFYKENPLRKQDSKLPDSPKFVLENTRRSGENIFGQTDAASSNGTPNDIDHARSTQSPQRAANGGKPSLSGTQGGFSLDNSSKKDGGVIPESDGLKKESFDASLGIASQETRGDSDAALKAAANDLTIHEGKPNGGGLVSPPVLKRKSLELDGPDSDGDRESKKARLTKDVEDDDDEGEIKAD
ncbi:cyclin-like protein [Podospora didyma]|uniref:RNA polymerase II holoenzyme cyclin-like subunit n=1 Tax=Podospora didyma TaxID=330526 RepID=A0AAE0P545_9PEZI|nr:cyclin-like protein [Podospora didyma]